MDANAKLILANAARAENWEDREKFAAHLDALLDLLVWQDSTPARKWWHRWSAGAAFASCAAAAADLLSLAAARRATAAGTAAATPATGGPAGEAT